MVIGIDLGLNIFWVYSIKIGLSIVKIFQRDRLSLTQGSLIFTFYIQISM